MVVDEFKHLQASQCTLATIVQQSKLLLKPVLLLQVSSPVNVKFKYFLCSYRNRDNDYLLAFSDATGYCKYLQLCKWQ